MKRLLLVTLALFLSACGTTVLNYTPSNDNQSVSRAVQTIEKLTMTQHPKWRPEGVTINDRFIGWGFGAVTHDSSSAVGIGNVAIAGGTSSIHEVGDRLYYEDIKDVQLLRWKRRFKTWFVVSAITRDETKHIFRTRYEEDAHAYMDAFNVLINKRAP